MSRIARLEELLIADNADKIPIVDISDLSLSEDGKEKYITVGNLGVGGGGGTDILAHTVTGNPFDLIGLTAIDTLGIITPTDNPGTDERILKTATGGYLSLGNTLTVPSISSTSTLQISSISHLTLTPFGNLNLDSNTNLIRILASSSIQTDNFVSQAIGWRATYSGEIDARYIYADQMKIKLFIADLEQALAGSQRITKSVTTLARDIRIPYPGDSVLLYANDLPSAEDMAVFEDGDYIELKNYNRSGGLFEYYSCWGTVTSYVDETNKEQRWTFSRDGTNSLLDVTERGTPTSNSTLGFTLTLDKVTGVVENDLMLTGISLDRGATVTPPTDWILLFENGISTAKLAVYYKFATAAEPLTYDWTFDTAGNTYGSSCAYYNVHLSSSFYGDIVENFHDSVPGTASFSLPSVYGISNQGDMLVTFATFSPNTTVGLSAFVEKIEDGVGTIGHWFGDLKLMSTGNTGTLISNLDSNASYIAVMISIIPPYSLTLESGYAPPNSIVNAESIILDYGVSGNGYVETTAIDGLYGANSPYQRVVIWTTHPTNIAVRTQVGNLKGMFSAGDEFGLFAGEGTTDDDSYLRASNVGMLLNNIPIKLYSSGVQKVNIDPNGVDVWFSGNGGVDKRFYWNGSILTISGGINITSPSTFGGSGFLQIGSGTVDVDLAGWYFDNTRIVGQAGTPDDQVLLDLNGRILAGAGNVIVNRDGIQIKADTTTDYEFQNEQNAVTFLDSTGVETVARIIGIPGGLQIYSLQPDTSTSVASFGAILDGLIFAPSSPGFPRIIATIDASDGFLELLASSAIKLYANSSIVPDITIEQGVGVSFTQSISMPTNTAITFGGYGYGPKAGIAIGDITHDYTPTTGNWTTNGSTLLLSALNYTTIGFHDSANRVDFIRVGAGLITIGYDGGFGSANALFPGLVGIGASATRSLTVDGTIKSAGADATFTTSNWGKTLELDEGMAIQWLRNASSYSRGIGYTSDGNLYFFKSTANDNSAAPLYDLILYSSGWVQVTGINPTDGIGTSWAALTLNTGWVNYGAPYDNAGYKKVGDLVFLEGFVVRTSGTETIIATLPVGYRPAAQKYYTVATSTGYGSIVITTAGEIVHISGGFGFVQFDGLSFGTT